MTQNSKLKTIILSPLAAAITDYDPHFPCRRCGLAGVEFAVDLPIGRQELYMQHDGPAQIAPERRYAFAPECTVDVPHVGE